VVALVVVVLIGRVAWRVLWETGSVLVDTAPYTPEQLVSLVYDVPGTNAILRARSRGSQTNPSVDIDVQVAAFMTTAQTAAITDAIRERLVAGLGQVSEVEVHFIPEAAESPDYAVLARAEADRIGLSTHEVSTATVNGVNMLELHVEVPADQSLLGAHEQVTQLEQALIEQLPEIDEVVTHIEPVQHVTDETGDAPDALDQILRHRVLDLLHQHFPQVNWHHVRIHHQGDTAAISIHAALRAETRVADAHALAESAEILIRSRMSRFTRVTIHTEPLEAAG
jgi:divalent metal cation (Fe/Co/Zn/Cd) transporter